MQTPTFRRRTDQDAADTAPLRALVVDDHEAYRDYIAALVGQFGFEVGVSSDGQEALATLTSGPPVHLLIVDCEMPRMTGLALITAVRAIDELSDVYAVMLTGREDLETKISALRVGFDDFLFKSAGEMEISAKLAAARRIVSRQQRLDETVRELYGLATRDELTGLFNRRFFFSEAERILKEGRPINLVFFDLDDFKKINDTLGHLAGDRILRDVGAIFQRRTRHQDLIARYGGDEFVMLVSGLSPEETEVLAGRMGKEISAVQWTFGTETFSVGVTTGLSCSTYLSSPTVAQLLSAGDRDLYKNKWVKKFPDEQPLLYVYHNEHNARIVEMMTVSEPDEEVKGEARGPGSEG